MSRAKSEPLREEEKERERERTERREEKKGPAAAEKNRRDIESRELTGKIKRYFRRVYSCYTLVLWYSKNFSRLVFVTATLLCVSKSTIERRNRSGVFFFFFTSPSLSRNRPIIIIYFATTA